MNQSVSLAFNGMHETSAPWRYALNSQPGSHATVNFLQSLAGGLVQIDLDEATVATVDTYRDVVTSIDCFKFPWTSSALVAGPHTMKVTALLPNPLALKYTGSMNVFFMNFVYVLYWKVLRHAERRFGP